MSAVPEIPEIPEIPETVIGISPFGEPDARIAAAVSRAGGLGVLDLGTGDRRAREEFARLRQWLPGGRFGVRLTANCSIGPAELAELTAGSADSASARDSGTAGGDPLAYTLVLTADLLPGPDGGPPGGLPAGCRLLVEVTSPAEAARAAACGAAGLIARGSESGGRVGDLTTFVLLQRLLADPALTLPVWACGGIGPRTAAAAVIGGAAGVVLDSQLALLAESGLPEDITEAVRAMDGSETVVTGGQRLLRRRTPGAAPLPAGQDGHLAARFAERWGTAAATVAGITDAVLDAVRDEAAARLTGPGTPMCATLGTELPLVQGPMTRVSDQPAFAAAVADAGGLPFLALALLDGDRTRALLERTRAELGDRPWGVGILGFAGAEVRAAQLDAVRELRPSHAVIAGGRPSQAAALEAAGIRTFLHVPSPGLLRQFYDLGVRRFVFEGAECGGHVGPRASFPLWEAQLDVLEACIGQDPDAGRGLDVLFAGGIHDERSAAMTAALAAPLAARGAAVGVLMGTAYLFTEEAVRLGAIRPLFQRQVVAARETALLESAPGHATRCVPSRYTADYALAKQRLRADGVPDRRAWEELERLNAGRLRLASKGTERIGAELVPVGEDRQLAEGMFMAGEVAVLRSSTTTLRDLHHSVGPGAAAFHAARAAALRESPRLRARIEARDPARTGEDAPAPLRVAVVGMACMFPGAPDLPAFWANILGGVDSVTEVPAERWDPALRYAGARGDGPKAPGGPDGDGSRTPDGPDGDGPEAPDGPDLSASKWGGFLPPIPFDPLAYGIPPASLAHIEPVQLLALEAARRALADAGYAARPFDRARTSVIFGAESGSDLSNATTLRTVLPGYLGELPPELGRQLPRLTEDTFPGVLANVISGRIANRLDLGGANYTVDAACASSLAAVDLACKELAGGTSDTVLCGAADLHNGINDYLLFSSAHALSPTGRSRTFDATADGTTLGEGVACVVLKRLADAERDGDRVYAVIDGVGASSDGRHLGLTAPRPEGQRAALDRAYRRAGVSPARVGLVEAHGTGTVVGDRTELTTLTEVFRAAGAAPGSCVLGSVKSQIGHTKCAAGLAGLIKTALALHTGIRPPTLHLTRPNPAWRPDTSPFAFHTAPLPWAAPAAERIAGVSAFGFGGTNFHVVLRAHEDAAPPRHGLELWPAELLTFRGADHASAAAEADWLLGLLCSGDLAGRRLRDIAFTAARRAESRPGPVRIAIVADTVADLPDLLRKAAAGHDDPAAGVFVAGAEPGPPGKTAVLFPGQGSQRPGMAAELLTAHPETRQRYATPGRAHAAALWPPAAFDPDTERRQRAAVTDTRTAQPGLGIADLAAYDVLVRSGIRPDMAAGHSYGELVAFCAAGSLTPETLLDLSARRAEAILAATGDGDPGTMAAVAAGADETEAALREYGLAGEVVVANRNTPRQSVISGPTAAVRDAARRLREAGLRVRDVPVACAFHSPLVAAAGERFAEALARTAVRAPEFPVWSNRTATVHDPDPEAIRAALAAQIAAPVRFAEQIEAMYGAGARVFVEAGPGTVLTGLLRAILGDRPFVAVPLEPRPGAGLRGMLAALARLAVAGLPVRTGWLFHDRGAVDLTRAPHPRPTWTVSGHLVRTPEGEVPAGGLGPVRRISLRPAEGGPAMRAVSGAESSGGSRPDGAYELVSAFLASSREMVAAQREVLLRYFGGPWPAAEAGAVLPVPGTAAEGTAVLPTASAPASGASAPAAPGAVADAGPAGGARRETLGLAAGGGAGDGPAPALTRDRIRETVTAVVSERTGYPVDMIEPGLDLEADLSIDSIKRTEVAGELARRLGGTRALGDEELADLTQARTVAAITQWLTARLVTEAGAATDAPADATAATAAADGGAPAGGPALPRGVAPLRFVVEEVQEVAAVQGAAEAEEAEEAAATEAAGSQPGHGRVRLGGRRVAVVGGGAVGDALMVRLAGRGAEAVAFGAEHELREEDGAFDGVLLVGALEAEEDVLPGAFGVVQGALRGGPRWVLGVKAEAAAEREDPGAGLRGLFRSLAREFPEALVRLVEVAPREMGAAGIADALIAELDMSAASGTGVDGRTGGDGDVAGGAPVVVRRPGGRYRLALTAAPELGALAVRGAGPAGDGVAEAAALGLDQDAVVVLAGGARGITAGVAMALAAASRCRVELLGRTPLPAGPGDPELDAATGERDLRALLTARTGLPPARVEQDVRLVLAQREVADTLQELRRLGSPAGYRTVDLRDAGAVHQAVKEIHAEHGRLDGVVHAAGVIEDRLFAEKDFASFERVYGTKVDGARALLDAVDELPGRPRFAVLFGSIAAVLGNRGQSDYAAANDALQSLGTRWALRTGNRALTVHWGPWAPLGTHPGMVSPALARSYEQRGIALIDPEEGALALLRELAWGEAAVTSVVLTASQW